MPLVSLQNQKRAEHTIKHTKVSKSRPALFSETRKNEWCIRLTARRVVGARAKEGEREKERETSFLFFSFVCA